MLRVKGWVDFQHYKDRRPPWIKLHRELLENFRWHRLTSDSKALAICIWLVACEYKDPKAGLVTDNAEELAFRARMDELIVVQSIKQLIQEGFLEHVDDGENDLLAPCYQPATTETETKTYRQEVEDKDSCVKKFSEMFLEFWELYPRQRRGDKDQAYRAWKKVLKDEKSTERKILDGLDRYRNSREVKEGYSKGAAAWLNAGKYNDNYEEPTSDNTKSYSSTIIDATSRAGLQLSIREDEERISENKAIGAD